MLIKAWSNALVLATHLAESLEALQPDSIAYNTFKVSAEGKCGVTKASTDEIRVLSAKGKAEFKNCYRMYLASYHVAYGQFFGADPDAITKGMYLAPCFVALSKMDHSRRSYLLKRVQPEVANGDSTFTVAANLRTVITMAANPTAPERDGKLLWITMGKTITTKIGNNCAGGTQGKIAKAEKVKLKTQKTY